MNKQRTQQEIEELKREWCEDPCWDIEDTEGFEAHHDELKAWREELRRQHAQNLTRRLERRAAELECSVALVRYIEVLESSLWALKRRVDLIDGWE